MQTKNFNYDQWDYPFYMSKLLFHGRTVGVCPLCLTAAAWVGMGHADFLVQECNQTISRDNYSEVFRLWWCALITHCAHSFSPNSLSYFSSLCLSSSLLCVSLPFICCHSVFVWTDISLSLLVTQSPPHGYAGFGQACILACTCLFACSLTFTFTRLICRGQTKTHTLTSERPGKEMKRLRETYREMKWTHSPLLHSRCLPWERMEHNRKGVFLDIIRQNKFITTVRQGSAAVNVTTDLSHP